MGKRRFSNFYDFMAPKKNRNIVYQYTQSESEKRFKASILGEAQEKPFGGKEPLPCVVLKRCYELLEGCDEDYACQHDAYLQSSSRSEGGNSHLTQATSRTLE